MMMLLMLVKSNVGLTDAIALVLLLLSMDWREVRGRMVSRRVDRAGLLAMADEVLEVLYRTHLSGELRRAKNSSASIERV